MASESAVAGPGGATGPVTRADIEAATELIEPYVRRTPVLEPGAGFVSATAGVTDGGGSRARTTRVVCKLELLQHTGSFKPRGAMHRALTSDIPASGLIAASGGNHGLAVAWVASRLGVPAEIFVPEVSPPAKVERVRSLGATVRVTGALYDDALAACRARQAVTGALDIHAYDHVGTIAGTGTIGREIEAQVPGVDTVLVALGGGGLASGIAAWFTGTPTRVVVVEPTSSSCYAAAVAAGEPVDVTVSGVAADSLGARRIGTTNWAALQAAGASSVLVDDDAIRDAQRRLWSETRLVAEPGGATAAAALFTGAHVPEAGETVVVVVCGANTDPSSVV